MEVRTVVRIKCGCGYQTSNPLEAEQHVRDTGHKMDVSGKVTPGKGTDGKMQ